MIQSVIRDIFAEQISFPRRLLVQERVDGSRETLFSPETESILTPHFGFAAYRRLEDNNQKAICISWTHGHESNDSELLCHTEIGAIDSEVG